MKYGSIKREYTGRLKYKSCWLSVKTYTEVRCEQIGWLPVSEYIYVPHGFSGKVWYEWVELTEDVLQTVFRQLNENFMENRHEK